MSRLSVSVVVVCLSVGPLVVQPARAQTVDPAFAADIQKLMDVTGSAEMRTQAANFIATQIVGGLRKSQPGIPERAFLVAKEVLDTEFAKAFAGPGGITSVMIPIYAKYFTHEEVKGLLSFYGTDLGKKAIAVMPKLFQEGAGASQQWMAQNMARINMVLESRLRAEGFIK
jgi:uncharacterized protein